MIFNGLRKTGGRVPLRELVDPGGDVGENFGGDGFFDAGVLGAEAGGAMLEKVVQARIQVTLGVGAEGLNFG